MAPLLGRKPFPLVKPLPGEESLFTIAHTQETFRTREYPFLLAPAWSLWGGARWAEGSPGLGATQLHARGSCQCARRGRAYTLSRSPRF